MRKLLVIILLVAFVLLTACDVVDLDATTRTEPTPPPNHDAEMAMHEARIATREAMR